MTETIRVLREARELIARGWTQEVSARDANGTPVAPTDDTATCWCTIGALMRAGGARAASALAAFLPRNTSIPRWNDAPERTQAEVLALFGRAIEAEEARNR